LLIVASVVVLLGCRNLPPVDEAMAVRSLARAKVLYQEGNFQAAKVAFQTYRSGQTDRRPRAEGYYWEGMCHLAQREFAAARQKFDLAARESPDGWLKAYVLCGLGEAFMGLGDFAAAQDAFTGALAASSQDIRLDHVLLRLATCAQRQNQWDTATTYLNRLLGEIPQSPLLDQAKEKLQYNKRRFFTVQVGAYKNEQAARKRAAELKTQEMHPFVGQIQRGNETLYCVWVGRFDSWEEANLHMQKIRGMGRIEDAIVKP